MQFVSFYLETQMYAVDILMIREINPNTAVMRVPMSENTVFGLINIRGQVICIMDIAVMLSMQPRSVTADSHIIILKTDQELQRAKQKEFLGNNQNIGDKPIGFFVDKIGEVITVEQNAIERVPAHIDESIASFFTGIIRGGSLVTLINISKLIAHYTHYSFDSVSDLDTKKRL